MGVNTLGSKNFVSMQVLQGVLGSRCDGENSRE